ncbi:DUF4148 domain-containing protein [Paraburkholderia dipogonis]|uniref:DUF4148 domain-containing protein n=1 Tax=Paraburkholderia dipogonis TaxID=1211383 RepID=A0A4Y8MQ74_9BURK|nr:DUF4148 domain-containing protein [Paraburkholderia dipogonis]TFE39627.1 DUF4148 domain-containing protein [Paraburkholderia dipogonis]
MKNPPKMWPMLCALVLLLGGCAAGGSQQSASHLSALQCQDLAALKNNAPPTPQRNRSELAALRSAGYDPSRWFDPYYPEDLQAAQRQVGSWFAAECQKAPPA